MQAGQKEPGLPLINSEGRSMEPARGGRAAEAGQEKQIDEKLEAKIYELFCFQRTVHVKIMYELKIHCFK